MRISVTVCPMVVDVTVDHPLVFPLFECPRATFGESLFGWLVRSLFLTDRAHYSVPLALRNLWVDAVFV
jgi:hypothetical protein